MTPERWRQIEDLYHSARERGASALSNADPELRAEVEKLLAQDGVGNILNRPAFTETAGDTFTMPPPGSRFGPYQVEGLLGEGGMGQVYRATDSRLGRKVAIKVSPSHFSDRFEREARAIAALNHPNICTLYDVGPNYLVMELVEGETLAVRLKRGRLSLDETMRYGEQMASALTAAHGKGIIHRDLKPGNVMIAKDGVKLLDFGLARSAQDQTVTQSGVVIGTPAYMAPEQQQSGACDQRTDIHALGLMLFEMATGTRAMAGVTPVLDSLPERLAHVVERCLSPDPNDRWQSARDVLLEIEWAGEAKAVVGAPRRRSRLWPAVAGLAILALFALALVHFREAPPVGAVMRSTILSPEKTSFAFATNFGPMALSPDGRRMAFAATAEDGSTQLWLRTLETDTSQPLPGTGGATFPFWSPDSRLVAFFSDGKLKKIDTRGGPPVSLAEAYSGLGGSWSANGTIVFAPSIFTPLQKIPADGGTAKTALPIDIAGHGFPWFLPDGDHFLFAAFEGAGRINVHVGSLSASTSKIVAVADSNAIYSDGYLLYLRENALMAQPFDPRSLRTTGEAAPIAEKVQQIWSLVAGGVFSASAGGLLAYQTGADNGLRQLTWFDRTGKPEGTLGSPRAFFSIEFSRDGRNLMAAFPDALGNYDLWMYDVARGLPTRFTFDPAGEYWAVWSPDGKSVVFNSTRKGHYDLYRKAANGTGAEDLLYADDTEKVPSSWSPDGKYLLYYTGGGLRHQMWVLPMAPEHPGDVLRPVPLGKTGFNEAGGKFSPNGEWVLFESDESGRNEVYVLPFARPSERRQVSTGGGRKPRWSGDSSKIFYVSLEGQFMSVDVKQSGDTLELGKMQALFTDVRLLSNGCIYDVLGNGERILVGLPAIPKDAEPLTLIQNWTSALKK